MRCYAIGIGGTGARAMECLIHLCAAGLGPSSLTMTFVDLDLSNGNLERTQQLARTYQALRALRRSPETAWLGTEIALSLPPVWTPFADHGQSPTLEAFFQAQQLRIARSEAARLLEYAYEPRQLALDLSGGFRAMPSIGAAVFGAKVDVRSEEPWRTLGEQIRALAAAREDCRVFVCGSIFGGTGASGFPTLGRLLRQGLPEDASTVAQAGALLLPYFGFSAPRPRPGEPETTLYARSEDFLLQTHAGLEYYAAFQGDLGYQRVYVIGDSERAMYETHPFGREQANPPHFIELLAASAALDFFRDRNPRDPARRVAKVARRSQKEFGWRDVPYRKLEDEPRGLGPQQAIGQYARMSFAYLGSLYPALVRARQDHAWKRPVWIRNLLDRSGVGLGERVIEQQRELSRSCFDWLHGLQGGTGGNTTAVSCQLFQLAAAPGWPQEANFDETLFAELVYEARIPARTVENVWRGLAAARRHEYAEASGFGLFQSALFRACR